jgi:hypothetical protein
LLKEVAMNFEPFESPRILLEDLKETMEDFSKKYDGFMNNCTYDQVTRNDNKTGETVVSLKFHHNIPPRLHTTASRIITDLRSVLDQATCSAALVLGNPKSIRKVYFPTSKTAPELDLEVRKLKKNEVNDELADFLRSYDAYQGGNDLLYTLCAMAGPIKHQEILRVSRDTDGFVIDGRAGPWGIIIEPGSKLGLNNWNRLRNELEFHRFARGSCGTIPTRPILKLVLGNGKPPIEKPAPAVLSSLLQRVGEIVSEIEAKASSIRAK